MITRSEWNWESSHQPWGLSMTDQLSAKPQACNSLKFLVEHVRLASTSLRIQETAGCVVLHTVCESYNLCSVLNLQFQRNTSRFGLSSWGQQ